MIRVLVGIDDTDNQESRGTGFRSRQLGNLIEEKNLGEVDGISRHQLFFDPRIPYTSQNSSACLDVLTTDIQKLTLLCREFLIEDSAIGSDAGLAIKEYAKIDLEIEEWGRRAKREVLSQKEALDIAKRKEVYLEGLTGDKDGVIGSLAAIGLRKYGNDGRFIWLRGKEIRELNGVYLVQDLLKISSVDHILDKSNKEIPYNDRVDVGTWVRPTIREHKTIIFVDKSLNNINYEWTVATKDYIKSISD